MRTGPAVLSALGLSLLVTPAAASDLVTEVLDPVAFEEAFCVASRDRPHIFVVQASMFVETRSVLCQDGVSTLHSSVSADDPGHTVFSIDPPHGVENAFNCDGKADTGMAVVALNCIPVSAETAAHRKT